MKNKLWLLYPVFALLLAFSLAMPVSAADNPVPLPHNFYGSVTIGTEPAPAGMEIEASGAGVMTGIEGNPLTTTEAGAYGGSGPLDPKLRVQGYIAEETPIEFYVGGARAQCREPGTETWLDSYPWHTGGKTELDLWVDDITAPTVTITSTASDPTNTSPIPVTATFSEDVTGFEVGDITVGNGVAGNFAGSGAVYTFDVTPVAEGEVTVDIAADVAIDAATNGNEAAPTFTINFDDVAPTVTIASTASDPTNTSPIPVIATFSEGVTGFELGDIDVTNGTAGSFAGSGADYTFDVTPTAQGAVKVDIAADVATDAASNPNEAATQFSITYDTEAPAVTVDEVTTPTNVDTLTLTGTMEEGATVELTSVEATCGDVSYDTTTWSCEVTLVEDSNVITATATDATGNTATVEVTIDLDTVTPVVEITSPLEGALLNTLEVTIVGTATEVAEVMVDGDTASVVDGAFSIALTLTEGANSVTATATDAAGNVGSDTVDFTIDVTPPAVTIALVTSPTNIATQSLTGTRSAGLTVGLTSTEATFGAVTYPTTTTWSCYVTLVEGSNGITATADTSTATATIVLDTAAPTVVSKSPAASAPGVAVDTEVTATFSEAMDESTITTDSFTLNGVSGAVIYDANSLTATFTPSDNLTLDITYTANLSTAITDAVGNPLAEYSWSFTTATASLGELVDDTPSGGTLTLGAGTYSGNVTISQSITITGTVGTIISGGILIKELPGSEFTIENVTITDYTEYGIWIELVGADDVFIIRNNTILGVEGSVVGIKVDRVDAGGSLNIRNNAISDNEVGIKLLAAVADATIHFNDITGNTVYGLEQLAVVSNASAICNWWGDISGPEYEAASFESWPNNPGGLGDAVSNNVDFTPWLTRDFQTVLDDNIAYLGYPMVMLNTGWNTLSTPIALDPVVEWEDSDGIARTGVQTWGDYIALGDGLAIDTDATTYYFDGEIQDYVQVLGTYRLKPCDAIYVKMAEPDVAAILLSPSVSVPSKQLYAGWNLVSLAWFGEGEIYAMPANEALLSVAEVTGDLTGYVLVVSPSVNQASWIYTGGTIEEWTEPLTQPPPDGWMEMTSGYWVFMLNDGTLAGFTFTPMSLGM